MYHELFVFVTLSSALSERTPASKLCGQINIVYSSTRSLHTYSFHACKNLKFWWAGIKAGGSFHFWTFLSQYARKEISLCTEHRQTLSPLVHFPLTLSSKVWSWRARDGSDHSNDVCSQCPDVSRLLTIQPTCLSSDAATLELRLMNTCPSRRLNSCRILHLMA